MPKRSQFVLKLLPSFTDFAFLMPIAYLFGVLGGSRSLLNDCDTGWHIRTGEWILANHRVPLTDVFSFSKPGEPWFAWEWLSDILFAWLNAFDGLRALLLFTVALICATFTLLYLLSRRKSNVLIAVALTMVAAAASSIHWLARPHLFTLLFLVIFYGGLERVREGRTRAAGIPWLAIFPAVTLLWTNLHGAFFIGILMIAAYGGGEFLRGILAPDPQERQEARRNAGRYFLSAAACLAVSFINPYTYQLHTHIIRYVRDPWNSEHIVEFLSPNFHHVRAIYFEVYLFTAIAAGFWFLARRQYTEPILIGLWLHASLLAVRNIPVFVIVAAPIIGAAVQTMLDGAGEWPVAAWLRHGVGRFQRMAAGAAGNEAVPRFHLVSALGYALVAVLMFAPHPPPKFRPEFDPERYPSAALAAIHPDGGSRIFTNDEWGDYLIWRLYPKSKVFVDGRSDFYGDEFEDKYADIVKVQLGWEKTLSRFGVNTILMPLDAPLTGALKESRHWRVVYDDGRALVFRSNDLNPAETDSAAVPSGGVSRDREVTKTEASDQANAKIKSKS